MTNSESKQQKPLHPEGKNGRTVTCSKFKKEMPGLASVPWPGELGQRV